MQAPEQQPIIFFFILILVRSQQNPLGTAEAPEGGSIWCLGEAPARAGARGEPACAGGLSARRGATAAVAASACWCSLTSDFSACRTGTRGSACCLCLRVDPDQRHAGLQEQRCAAFSMLIFLTSRQGEHPHINNSSACW